jgi:hypothetical protein
MFAEVVEVPMRLNIVAGDCLVLNWALSVSAVAEPPSPLRYERHSWDGKDHVFASALLFFQENLQLKGLPLIRLSYPQFCLALHTLDGEGMPCLLLESILMPAWVVPAARLLGHEVATTARFDYPRPSREPDRAEWTWSVGGRRDLRIRAELASPQVVEGPAGGSWQPGVEALRCRHRGYYRRSAGLAEAEISFPATTAWPMRVTVVKEDLLYDCLRPAGGEAWPELHSAWLSPEIASRIELARSGKRSLPKRMPEPAPSQRAQV